MGGDHEGGVLDSFVKKSRDRRAALKFLKKSIRRHDRPDVLVTDGLGSYGGRPEGRRPQRWSRDGSLGQQSGGEFPSAVPKAGAGDAAVPADV